MPPPRLASAHALGPRAKKAQLAHLGNGQHKRRPTPKGALKKGASSDALQGLSWTGLFGQEDGATGLSKLRIRTSGSRGGTIPAAAGTRWISVPGRKQETKREENALGPVCRGSSAASCRGTTSTLAGTKRPLQRKRCACRPATRIECPAQLRPTRRTTRTKTRTQGAWVHWGRAGTWQEMMIGCHRVTVTPAERRRKEKK